jgi:hypothetical protein
VHRQHRGAPAIRVKPLGAGVHECDERGLAGATSAADLLTLGPQIEEVLRREKRVAGVSVVLSTTTGAHAAQYRLLVAVAARLVTGETLERVVGVNNVSVEFLAAGR